MLSIEFVRLRSSILRVSRGLFRNLFALPVIKVVKLSFLLLLLFMVTGNSSCINVNENTAHFAENSNHNISGYIDGGQNDENISTMHDGADLNNESNVDRSHEDEGDESNPHEIQKAVCTVTAGEVKASAEAVTTKTLKGVCGSAEMNLALSRLESKLYNELQEIKNLIKLRLNIPQQSSTNLWEEQQMTSTTALPLKPKPDVLNFHQSHTKTANNAKSQSISINSIDEHRKNVPKLKSLPRWQAVDEREQEVSKFNNTMLSDRDLKVFTYYWKLENFSDHIATGESHTVESPIFSIKGKPLHVKAIFQHLHRDFLLLQLENAALSMKTNRNNIILDTGGLFKEIVNDKVLFKYKIRILDQNNQRAHDLVSQEFINLETGFLIPNSALLASYYVKNNSLLIQIFLNL